MASMALMGLGLGLGLPSWVMGTMGFFFFVLLMVGEGGVDGRLWVAGGGGVRCV